MFVATKSLLIKPKPVGMHGQEKLKRETPKTMFSISLNTITIVDEMPIMLVHVE